MSQQKESEACFWMAATAIVLSPVITVAGLGYIKHLDYAYSNAVVTEQKVMEEQGLFGEHPIVDLATLPGFASNSDIQGGLRTYDKVTNGKTVSYFEFAWKLRPDDKIVQISELPADKVKFAVIDEDAQPTVEFKFDNSRPVVYDDPTNYISKVDSATFTFSQKDFDQLRPQGK